VTITPEELAAVKTREESLAAIRERCEMATPGPWVYDNAEEITGIWYPDEEESVFIVRGSDTINEEDAAFIAASRTDVPFLLKEVDVLGELLELNKELAEVSFALFMHTELCIKKAAFGVKVTREDEGKHQELLAQRETILSEIKTVELSRKIVE